MLTYSATDFLLGFFSPRIANDIGPLILLIFTGVLTFGFVYIYFMLPETRGMPDAFSVSPHG